MKSLSENIRLTNSQKLSGFSLVEITTSLIILALVCSSVLAVINRCLRSTADITSRMQAFEVARENMENLLSQSAVEEKVDYGTSDEYPHIDWETNVETFYEPLTDQMWVRAVCSAQYTDTEGEEQSVELSHWLTNVSKQQLINILKEQEKRKEHLVEAIMKSIEEAAEYVEVNVNTVQMWVGDGMPRTKEGYYIKDMLDLYKQTNGYPTDKQIEQRKEAFQLLANSVGGEIIAEPTAPTDTTTSPQDASGRTPQESIPGYTEEQLANMTFSEVWQLLLQYADQL
ncbi:hypothetical protein ACFL1G_04055 [Planctomycetota bacterium]